MFAFNDGLIDESLAFHVSTNTFNNPAFDQNLADLANQVDLAECQITRKGTSKSSSRIVERQSKESGVRDDRRETTAGQSFKSSFAENLAFSFRSKLFVIDLNFKRKLRSLKTFAVRYFPRILFQQSAAATSSRRKNSSDNRTGTSFTNRNKIYDSDEQFWKNIIVDPSSRKSLTKQKAKILNRLERALEQIRSQNRRDVDDYYQQQQQQQNIPENNRATFVRQFEQTSDGLRHIRPGILGHLLLHHSDSLTSSSFSRPSTSTPPSSSSSSSSLAAAAPAAASSVGQPIVIGSQNWAQRQRNCRSKVRDSSGGSSSKWKQIRDLVFEDANDTDDEAQNSKKLCIICYTNMPNIVTLPCKHHDVCSDCFIEMIYIAVKKSQYPLKCALCRQKVEKIRCSRKLLLSVIEKQRLYP